MLLSPRINVMLQSVRNASKYLMRDFNELQISHIKSSDFFYNSYVKSRNVLHKHLYGYRQDYGFVFEDNHAEITVDEENYTWFIIPINGKSNFSSYIVYFSIAVCLMYKNRMVAAVVHAPALKETFWAEEKKGAFVEDFKSRCVRMRGQRSNGNLVDCYNIDGNTFAKLSSTTVHIRSIGSIILGFTYIAAGRYSSIIYSEVNKYNIMLGKLFMQESGVEFIIDNDTFLAGNTGLV